MPAAKVQHIDFDILSAGPQMKLASFCNIQFSIRRQQDVCCANLT
jgi:hypothetical protein